MSDREPDAPAATDSRLDALRLRAAELLRSIDRIGRDAPSDDVKRRLEGLVQEVQSVLTRMQQNTFGPEVHSGHLDGIADWLRRIDNDIGDDRIGR